MKKIPKKEQILAAAANLFTQNGFDGTSIADIAQAAEVNHSLIFHYFGNKEKLWVAVKEEISRKAHLQKPVLPSSDLPFKEFLSQLFDRMFVFYQTNPQLVRMFNWQRLEPVKNRNIGVTESPEMQTWLDVFKAYQVKGEISKEIEPAFLVTMVLSIISASALDPNIYIADEKNKRAYINFCVTSLLKAAHN